MLNGLEIEISLKAAYRYAPMILKYLPSFSKLYECFNLTHEYRVLHVRELQLAFGKAPSLDFINAQKSLTSAFKLFIERLYSFLSYAIELQCDVCVIQSWQCTLTRQSGWTFNCELCGHKASIYYLDPKWRACCQQRIGNT